MHEAQVQYLQKERSLKEFTTDGCVNKNVWESQDKKILFYLKEHYGYQGCGVIEMKDLVNGWLEDRIITTVRCVTQAASFFEAFSKGEELTEQRIKEIFNDKELLKSTLEKISFINIKKNSGESVSKDQEIRKESRKNAAMLKEQIENLKPDIIFCGGTVCWHSLIYDLGLFTEVCETPKPGYTVEQGMTLLHLNHPAARGRDYNMKKIHELVFKSQNKL